MNLTAILKTGFVLGMMVVLGASPAFPADKDTVLPSKRRATILTTGKALTDMENHFIQKDITGLVYPFALDVPTEEPEEDTGPEEAAPVVVTYTNEEVLAKFAENFKPSGMMARGDANYLIVDVRGRKQPLAENSLVRFNFEGKPYNIRIGEVSDDDYLLKLGEATLLQPLNESFDERKIKRFAPTP